MADKYAVICKADNIDTRATHGNLSFEGAKVHYRKHARNCTDLDNLWIHRKEGADKWVIVKNDFDSAIEQQVQQHNNDASQGAKEQACSTSIPCRECGLPVDHNCMDYHLEEVHGKRAQLFKHRDDCQGCASGRPGLT